MLERIKKSLRLYHNMLDSDLSFNIDACMHDLQRVGVLPDIAVNTTTDPLINKAAELYCKWQYDFGQKGDQYEKAYKSLRDAISLCKEYVESGVKNV